MKRFRHAAVGLCSRSKQGEQFQSPRGSISVGQMLNSVGQRGGELVTVVPVARLTAGVGV